MTTQTCRMGSLSISNSSPCKRSGQVTAPPISYQQSVIQRDKGHFVRRLQQLYCSGYLVKGVFQDAYIAVMQHYI